MLGNRAWSRLPGGSAIRRVGRGLALLGVALFAAHAQGRDRGADGSLDKRTSAHFNLYQDVDITFATPDSRAGRDTKVFRRGPRTFLARTRGAEPS